MIGTETKRITVAELEVVLYEKFPVLDHGFVRVIDYMGNDSSIVQAARVSYGTGTKSHSQDQALIDYLMSNNHTSPFEMCELKLHIKAPIFVTRQWLRHRTASVNEYSARYSVVNDEFYLPKFHDITRQSNKNKQGRDNTVVQAEIASDILHMLKSDSENAYLHYSMMIDNDISRELARINLTLNYYTEFYWKINLHNLLHFLNMRISDKAQHEIRLYASTILDIVKLWVPCVYHAFEEYKLHAIQCSKKSIALIKKILAGERICYTMSGMGRSEWNEFINIFGIVSSDE